MGTEIHIKAMEPEHFGVQVTEGDLTTSHRVIVRDGALDDLGVGGADGERVVRETFEFLLEREPASAILPDFAVEDVARFFAEFPEELAVRLSSGV